MRRGQPTAAAQVSAPSEGERLFSGLAENTPDAVVRIDRTPRPLHGRPAILVQEITERKVAEERLKESQSKLRNLAVHLLSAREEERKKVAREIHDKLGQVLTALKMRGMIGLTDQTNQRVHKISSELRPRMLDDLGLAEAIEWLMGDFLRRTGIRCKTAVQVTQSRIGGNSATAMYRIVPSSRRP